MKHVLKVHSILWAVLILATSIVLVAADAARAFPWLLTLVLIPIWFASDRLIRSMARAGGCR